MPDLKERLQSALNPLAATTVIQEEIDRLAGEAGGVVEIPPGEWTIATLFLRSGITLRLARGSTLKAHLNIDDYPKLPRGHNKDRQPYHLIAADDCDGITIEGDGVIDGQGMSFWDPPLEGTPGGKWWYRATRPRLSPLVEIRNCRDVILRDFTIRNSPGWTVHPYLCDRVTIRGITIANHVYGPNTDGLDINGCRDVFIADCNLTCGDDAIILKSTDDARPCERIAVTNCIIQSNCAALGLGAEVTHAIRDVAFSNCVIRGALRIIQIEMWEAGLIENIVFNNITGRTMTEIGLDRPIYLDIQQHKRGDGAPLGQMRNILISNFAATTRGRILMTAQDGSMLEHITLRDVHLSYPEIEDPEVTVPPSRSTQMSNYSPHSRAVRSALVADNVRELQVHNLVTNWPADAQVPMHGLFGRRIRSGIIDSPYLRPSRSDVERIRLVESEGVVLKQ